MATKEKNGDSLLRPVMILTATALLAFIALMLLYTQYGGAVLARLEVSVGEVLLEEGRRYQEAGALANARERYELALASRFEGPQNRVATEKQLGQLIYTEGDFAAALPHLEAATQGPHAQINAFEMRVEALLQQERADEIPAVLDAWRALATAMERDEHRAKAAYYEGHLAAERGDLVAAEAAFARGNALVPGGRNATELAWIYYQREDYAEAIKAIDAYLNSGAPGKRAEWMRNLREQAITKME